MLRQVFSRPLRDFHIVSNLPRTASWATLRRPLRDCFQPEFVARRSYLPMGPEAHNTLIPLEKSNRLHMEGLGKQVYQVHLLHRISRL